MLKPYPAGLPLTLLKFWIFLIDDIHLPLPANNLAVY